MASRQRFRIARMIDAAAMTVQSTALLPRLVTALTIETIVACPATRWLRWAAAPWSAESSGAHCTRTRTSTIAKTSAATLTATSGVRLRRERAAVSADMGSDLLPARLAQPVHAEDDPPQGGQDQQHQTERLVAQPQQRRVDAVGLGRVVGDRRVDDQDADQREDHPAGAGPDRPYPLDDAAGAGAHLPGPQLLHELVAQALKHERQAGDDDDHPDDGDQPPPGGRSEEHTSELQSPCN